MRLTVALLTACLTACGDAPPAGTVDPIPAPERTAAQDRAMRALLVDVARHRACDVLRDRFLPLPEDQPAAQRRVTEGRLWVAECEVTREEDRLGLHLSGRGWQWVERSAAGPLGSSFVVRGTVRLEASIDLSSALDVRYDEEDRHLFLALTPTTPPRATVRPIGTIPVEPEGGWSGLISGLGGLFGVSPADQARPLLEEEAGLLVQRLLARGVTFGVDLCTGQPDVVFGPIGDGELVDPPPFEGEGVRWIDNERVRLHPGGLDVSGPFSTHEGELTFELEVESGGPVDASVLCGPEAALLASAYLAGGEARPTGAVAHQSVIDRASLPLRAADCEAPHVVLTATADATVRYRVRRDGAVLEALIDCD